MQVTFCFIVARGHSYRCSQSTREAKQACIALATRDMQACKICESRFDNNKIFFKKKSGVSGRERREKKIKKFAEEGRVVVIITYKSSPSITRFGLALPSDMAGSTGKETQSVSSETLCVEVRLARCPMEPHPSSRATCSTVSTPSSSEPPSMTSSASSMPIPKKWTVDSPAPWSGGIKGENVGVGMLVARVFADTLRTPLISTFSPMPTREPSASCCNTGGGAKYEWCPASLPLASRFSAMAGLRAAKKVSASGDAAETINSFFFGFR